MSTANSLGAEAAPEAPVPARLVESLDRLCRARVAIITGPPGHDKRALVRAWLATRPEFTAHWVGSLEDLDAASEGFGSHSPDGLEVVVLSGSRALGDPQLTHAALDLAERHPRVRVVLVSRIRPDVALGSLAARGLLVDIDAAQLAWRRDELAEALALSNPSLDDEVIDCVHRTTRGWPLPCRLLSREPLSWPLVASTRQVMGEYLDEVVLAPLDEADVALLGAVAPLPRLEPLAAAWMTGQGEAAAQLTRLQARGVPILWEQGRVICLNPLLREHLDQSLAVADPELGRRLHERAAMWLRHRDQRLEAVKLAIKANLVDLAWLLGGELITLSLHRHDQTEVLTALGEVLPAGWALDLLGSLGRSLSTPLSLPSQLEGIDVERMVAHNDTGRLGYVVLTLAAHRLAGYTTEVDPTIAVQLAQTLDETPLDERQHALLAATRVEHGLWQLNHGLLRDAEVTLAHALGSARVSNSPWATVMSLGALALDKALLGSVDEARRLADEALERGADEAFSVDFLDEHALLAHTLLALDQGDVSAARGWLDRLHGHRQLLAENDALRSALRMQLEVADGHADVALRILHARRDRGLRPTTDWHATLVHRAALATHLATGDLDRAAAEASLLEGLELQSSITGAEVERARVLVAQGQPDEAVRLLQPLLDGPEPHHESPRLTLQLLLTHGAAAEAAAQPGLALASLQRAHELAERLGLGGGAVRLPTGARPSGGTDDLTEAELNVLAHLSSDRTLGQTAHAMFISVNTLKTHLRRIYRKLGVQGREEAIDRARLMGIQQF